MKRAILVFLLGLTVLVSQAQQYEGPIKGLVDADTGTAIPDARTLFTQILIGDIPKTITVGPSPAADFDNLEAAIVEAVKFSLGFANASANRQILPFVIEIENGVGYTLPANFVIKGANATIRAQNSGQVTITSACDSTENDMAIAFNSASISFDGVTLDASDCTTGVSVTQSVFNVSNSTITAGAVALVASDGTFSITDSIISSEGVDVPDTTGYGAILLLRKSHLEIVGNTTINGHTSGVMSSYGDVSIIFAPRNGETITIRGSEAAIFLALNSGGGYPTAVIVPPNFGGTVVLESTEGFAIESTPTARVTYRASRVTFNGAAMQSGNVNQPLNKLLIGGGFVSNVEGAQLSLLP